MHYAYVQQTKYYKFQSTEVGNIMCISRKLDSVTTIHGNENMHWTIIIQLINVISNVHTYMLIVSSWFHVHYYAMLLMLCKHTSHT